MIQPNREISDGKGSAAARAYGLEWSPEIIAFCCSYCGSGAAALAGANRLQYPAGVRILQTPCTGKVEMEHILEAFEKGIDGILVIGCLEGGCHFVEGNLRARKRTDRIRAILDEIGLRGERLKMINVSDAMAAAFVHHIEDLVAQIRDLGPNPLKESK
jgi:F420-non-reducing hydrogenase iron-sulfur subunit